MAKRILLADDSLTIQKVVELTLSGTPYDLLCVSDGQKALESLSDSRPDLILADAVMPGKNGYEVCEAVKSNPTTARIPVVLLSGIFEPFDRDRAERIGCDLIVSKPFDAQQLVEHIEGLLARAASAPAPESPPEEAPFQVPSSAAFEPPPPELVPEGGAPFLEAPEEGRPPFSEAPEVAEFEPEAASEPPEPQPVEAVETTPAVEEPLPPLPEPPREPAPAETAASERALAEAPVEEGSPAEAPAPVEERAQETRETPPPVAPAPALPVELTEEQIERIAARVVEKLSDRVIREIAWEVVPDAAEVAVKRRIAELESGAE